ncbi:MAG: hypothetical protein GY810_19075 [Aureispira sp.]|nr:hypothetical protein [Aureispira sp.]
MNKDTLLEKAAFMFHKHGHNLASSMAFAVLAQKGSESAAVWCGLGSTLAKSAGQIVRKPFLEGAAKALKRCYPLSKGTDFESVSLGWLESIAKEIDVKSISPIRDDELAPLIKFLDIDPKTIPNAIDAVPVDDQMFVIMALGEQRNPIFLPAINAAINCKWGDEAARSALKRLGGFGYQPSIEQTLATLQQSPKGEELQPYLGFALQHQQKLKAEQPPAPKVTQPKPAPKMATAEKAGQKKPWWKFW